MKIDPTEGKFHLRWYLFQSRGPHNQKNVAVSEGWYELASVFYLILYSTEYGTLQHMYRSRLKEYALIIPKYSSDS